MSIFIKDMRMPNRCEECPFIKTDITRDLTYCFVTRHVVRWWMKTREQSSEGSCPLVELPAQHGRLIDADSVVARIQEAEKQQPEIADVYWDELRTVLMWLKSEPTIIEAEVRTE